jgi:hypothetical protein
VPGQETRHYVPGRPPYVYLLSRVAHAHPLRPLAATGGTYLLARDRLAAPGARDFLASRLGPGRIAGEPEAADEIIERCARLPQTIVAARPAAKPDFPLPSPPPN